MPPKATPPTLPSEGASTDDPKDSFVREAPATPDPVRGEPFVAPSLTGNDVLADRFVIERLAGHGGMGTVYRALDRVSGLPVALKVMARGGQEDERFAQEVRVLSELSHPAIVRYVAHGFTTQGQPFLAMEWLEGQDLAKRLDVSGLSVAESLAVVRRVAEGLAIAHARGVVHRDVKPSNVFLIGDDPSRTKLIDFGIVRLQLAGHATVVRPMTRTGMILGTVGYMSPEQATADRALDARADIFALGCIAFECLTGEPAFSGAHLVAVLAKVLREEAPRMRQLRPDLPPVLDDLVARMLSKDRAGRPADASAVLRELEALGSISGGVPEAAARPPVGLSGGEQRLVSVMLAVVLDDATRVNEIVRRHGGDPVRLANGALLVTLSGRGSASEQVVTAAGCALELRDAFPLSRIALATGRAQASAGGPLGLLIDQAAALLAQSTSSGIRIDEVTSGLLGERFEVRPEGKGQVLFDRRSDAEPPRTLLGKPTPCVGRDKELGLLDATLRECVEESVARAVLVTGPAGQGKSRLRHEFVVRARDRGDVAILVARADPVGAGSAFMMVRQLVRQAVRLRDGDPAGEQHARLRAYVAEVCKNRDFARIADFLGELLSVPSTERPSPELRAARNDARIMGEWLQRSFGEWLAAECAARPLLVVLEDLHWGDLPSVMYLGEGLRSLKARPLMVLTLGRPEVHEVFPRMWAGAEMTEIPLGRLTPRAAERLVRAAGESIPESSVTRIVERADGNAFYLEELIRRVAEGGGDTLPDTVLALVQSRLERLEPEARRIVRAASVFGEVFWRGGVARLLGGAGDIGDLDAWLEALVRGEVISLSHNCRYPGDGETEYTFRHGLLREAAYAMLTPDDRTTGHRLAGEWLELVGEKDPLTMGDHLERGGEPKRAVPWLVHAARAAFDGGNMDAAIALGNRGIACGAEGTERGLLRFLLASTLAIRQGPLAYIEGLLEAMGLAPVGSTLWFRCAASAFMAGAYLGDTRVTTPVLEAIASVAVQPEPTGSYGRAVYSTSVGLWTIGQFTFARSFLKRAEETGATATDPDPAFVLHSGNARAFLELAAGELGDAFVSLAGCRGLADRTGDAWGYATAGLYTVLALGQTGSYGRVEAALGDLRAFCDPRRLDFFVAWATADSLASRSREAISPLATLVNHQTPFLAAVARTALARALVATGDLQGAQREATSVVEKGSAFPSELAAAFGVSAHVALQLRQPAEALSLVERGLEAESRTPWPSSGSVLRLVRAEALHALARVDDARTAIREARERILRIAATLDGDPSLRESYLTSIAANARTLERASEW